MYSIKLHSVFDELKKLHCKRLHSIKNHRKRLHKVSDKKNNFNLNNDTTVMIYQTFCLFLFYVNQIKQ